MKKMWIAIAVLALVGCNNAVNKKTSEKGKDNVTDASLEQRLDEYMKINDDMNLDKVLDYTYPRLFEIAPREQMEEAMKQGFDNEVMTMDMDSVKVEKIYPTFEMDNGSYAKVDYSMIMIMNFKEKDAEMLEMMKSTMAEQYGEGNITIDADKNQMRIHSSSPLVAAKDKYSKDWTFANLRPNDPITPKIFSKELLDKLATY